MFPTIKGDLYSLGNLHYISKVLNTHTHTLVVSYESTVKLSVKFSAACKSPPEKTADLSPSESTVNTLVKMEDLGL